MTLDCDGYRADVTYDDEGYPSSLKVRYQSNVLMKAEFRPDRKVTITSLQPFEGSDDIYGSEITRCIAVLKRLPMVKGWEFQEPEDVEDD